jgi:hypothetical protein
MNTKKEKCLKWVDSIAKYQRKEYVGKCEFCLYQDDEAMGRTCPGKEKVVADPDAKGTGQG